MKHKMRQLAVAAFQGSVALLLLLPNLAGLAAPSSTREGPTAVSSAVSPANISNIPSYQPPVFERPAPRVAARPVGPNQATYLASTRQALASSGGPVYVASRGQIARSRDFYTSSSPQWDDIKGPIPIPMSGRGGAMELALDPFDPLNGAWVVTGSPDSGSNGGVWRTENLDDPSPTWTQVLNEAQIAAGVGGTSAWVKRIVPSTVQPGLIYLAVGSSGMLSVGKSTDYGTIWTWSTGLGRTGDRAVALEVSDLDTSRVWTSIGMPNGRILVSNDGGDSFTELASLGTWWYPYDIYVPEHGNEADDLMYTVDDSGLRESTDAGQAWTIVSPADSRPGSLNRNVGTERGNSEHVFYADIRCGGPWSFLHSSDGGSTWTTRHTTSSWLNSPWMWPTDPNRILTARGGSGFEGTPVAYYSSDEGFTWVDKTGDWFTSIGNFYDGAPGSCGGAASVTIVDAGAMARATLVDDDAVLSDGTPKNGSHVACDCPLSHVEGTQGSGGDPINTRTGGLDYSIEDLSIPTAAGPLMFVRSYSSLATDTYTEDLGFGWVHNLDSRLIFPGDPGGEPGYVQFKAHTANRYRFVDRGDGTYASAPGVLASLTADSGSPQTYTIVDSLNQTYTFDEFGVLQSWADAQGRTFAYAYDPSGRVDQVTGPSGSRYLSFTYDAQDRISSVTDQAGRSVSYGYDAAGDLVSVTDLLGGVWSYAYDAGHRLLEVRDPRGLVSLQTEYDAQGRAVRQFDGLGNLIVEVAYNADGTATLTDALNNVTTHAYDYRNTLVGETDALSGIAGKSYDPNFRPEVVTDEDGDTTQLAWSADGANLTQVIDAEGGQTDLTYDGLNNLTEVIDPRGFLTSYTYSDTRLTSTTDALGNATSYTYTAEGFLASATDARGGTTSYTYDAFGQRISMMDALGSTWTYSYDDLGRLVDTTDPLGRVTRSEYDAEGRPLRTTRNFDPGRPQNDQDQYNIVTEYVYDAIGNLLAVTDTFGRVTQFEYDDANRLIRTTDPAGNSTSSTYDAAGNLAATADALGRMTTYSYDELNRLVATTDPLGDTTTTIFNPDGTVAGATDALGRTTTYQYDYLKRVVSVTDALGDSTLTTYDASGNVLSTADALGRTTTFEYNALSRLIRQSDPLGGVTEHFYDEVGNRVQTVDPGGQAMTFAYDHLNRLESATDALGNVTSYSFDAVGNRVAVTDANGNTSSFTYDTLDRLVSTTDPLANLTATAYDALSNAISRTDANGETTTFAYDVLNRMTAQTDPLGGVTSFTYDAVGNQINLTDANGHTTTTAYDALNRPVSVTDPNGGATTTAYNAVGNVIAAINALGNATSFAYDALNRQINITDPEGNTTSFGYDEVGNRTSMTDAAGFVIRYEYDGLSRLTAVVENFVSGATPDNQTNVRTEYTYDANGSRLTIKDGNGNITAFAYDALNRLTSESDALGNTTAYGYDAVGNRTALLDAAGFTTVFNYDDANRMISIDYPAPDADVSFSYDANGNRTFMSDGVGATTWVYDGLNRVTSVTDPFGGVVGYGYDAVGNRTLLSYPDGKQVSYTYDPGNRMSTVADWDSLVTSYAYDAADRMLTTNLPNGVLSTYSYDAAGRLLSIFHGNGPQLLSSFEYIYDPNGNRVQVIENLLLPETPTPPPTDFVLYLPAIYGGAGKLGGTPNAAKFGIGTQVQANVYAPNNGTPGPTDTPTATSTTSWGSASDAPTPTSTPTATPPSVGVVIDYTYDPLQRLTAADYSTGEFFYYSYDAVGNRLTQDTLAGTNTYLYDIANRLVDVDGVPYAWDAKGNLLDDGVSAYTYDHANRLVQVVQGSNAYSFAYNGLGDRLEQTANGTPTIYSLDINRDLTQVLSDGTNAYLYGTWRTGEEQTGGWQYHLGDALGSVRLLADAYRKVDLARSYEPFGSMLASEGAAASMFQFTGQQRDGTGLTYLRARYYVPPLGRFLSRDLWEGDPNQPMSYNLWLYVGGSPVVRTDPSGMYGQLEVHRNLTLAYAKMWGRISCLQGACPYVDFIAELIAMGDYYMDEHPLYSAPVVGHPALHFVDQPTARRNAAEAARAMEPYLLGTALHQVQDWYSHWSEGYRWRTGGHVKDSFKAGCRGAGECRRDPELIREFFQEHPQHIVKARLQSMYGAANLSNVSEDKLIDLYLYTFTEPKSSMRSEYGYDTDYFFGFASRDLSMSAETIFWVLRFFEQLDGCTAEWLWLSYVPPTSEEVVEFLNTGSYSP